MTSASFGARRIGQTAGILLGVAGHGVDILGLDILAVAFAEFDQTGGNADIGWTAFWMAIEGQLSGIAGGKTVDVSRPSVRRS